MTAAMIPQKRLVVVISMDSPPTPCYTTRPGETHDGHAIFNPELCEINHNLSMIEYVGILVLGAMSAVIATLMLVANRFLGPKRPSAVKAQPFECGLDPIALPTGRLPVHFYVVAILFVVFDVELVFLFPWAVALRRLGWFGIVEMALFLAVVVAGFAYAWKKGALDFER